MSKKEEKAREYRLRAVFNTERYLEGGSNIERAYIAGWDACEAEFIEIIKTAEDHAYFAGSEAIREKLIEKACKWLEDNLSKQTSILYSGIVHINFDNVITEFRKAMEE